jgi:hypothetical protein
MQAIRNKPVFIATGNAISPTEKALALPCFSLPIALADKYGMGMVAVLTRISFHCSVAVLSLDTEDQPSPKTETVLHVRSTVGHLDTQPIGLEDAHATATGDGSSTPPPACTALLEALACDSWAIASVLVSTPILPKTQIRHAADWMGKAV